MNEMTVRKKEELDPQEKSFRRRKDIIKNFIIVFLVVMLILTFFSNTIMNYSLPSVAVQTVTPGTISSVIRGTGNVTSGDPYNVMVKQSKTVGSIRVKVGQEIKEGDLLLTLEAEDSQELADAKKALETAKNAYNAVLLSDKVDSAVISSAQGGIDVDSFRNQITNAQAAIKAAENNVKECQTAVDNLNNQISISSGNVISEAEKTNVANLKTTADNAEAAKNDADASLKTAKASVESAENALTAAQQTKDIAKATLDDAQATYDELAQFQTIKNKKDAYDNDAGDPKTAEPLNETEQAIYDAYVSVDSSIIATIGERVQSANAALIAASDAYTEACSNEAANIANAQAALDSAKASLDEAQKNYDNANNAYTTAYNNWKNANDSMISKENGASDTLTNLRNQLNAAQIKLNAANTDLESKKTILNELITKIGSVKELTEAQAAIDAAQAEVDKYQEQTGAADVTAPINGTILSINVASGKKTNPDEAVVTIQPEGQGYTMSFSLENEKAKTVSIGDVAEVANSWWYNDVTGTVATIRPDQSDPNRKKEITLNLEGSLVAGQSLTMSISSRSSNYDLVVPSSAIHDGNNGKYVLVVESKSSPLGNRYFANRYDVEVLASDDTQTAISGALNGYEYVVTTSSKPIEPGAQVRLPNE